jgi:hypothetical protein
MRKGKSFAAAPAAMRGNDPEDYGIWRPRRSSPVAPAPAKLPIGVVRRWRRMADTGIAGFAHAQAFCASPTFREELDQVAFSLPGIARSFDLDRIDRTMRQEKSAFSIFGEKPT